MNAIKEYKFKSKYLNDFFLKNNVLLFKTEENNPKITYSEMQKDSKKYTTIMISEKINSIKEDKRIRQFVFDLVKKIEKPECYYLDKRFNFNNQTNFDISTKMNIKIRPIDNKIKNDLIVYNFFKFKDLLKREGFVNFYEQYKSAGVNEYVDQVVRHAKGNIEDYFFICTLKNTIRIYKKEMHLQFNENEPPFDDKMLFEYLDNYFSKFAIVTYDNEKVKNFISTYYVSDVQAEDQVSTFVENFLLFYQMVTGNKFYYENKFKFDLTRFALFENKKARHVYCPTFSKYFDKVMQNINNYKNFMFMLEILDLTEHVSIKKRIINYILIMELLLVNGNKNISSQIQKKCMLLLKNKNYCYEELKLAYDYRSKIIHGEYKAALEKTHELALIKYYKFSKEELDYEIYLNYEQMIEERLCERLRFIVKTLLKKFIFNNSYLTCLKIEKDLERK